MTKNTDNGNLFRILVPLVPCLLVVIFLTFSSLIGIRYTNSDDMHYCLMQFQPYWNVAKTDAIRTGRISQFYSMMFFIIPHFVWDTPLYDLFMYGPIIVIPLMILWAFTRYARQPLYGIIFVILYFSFIPVTYHFNLIVSNPLKFTLGIILFLVSMFCMNLYFSRKQLIFIYSSSIFLFLSFMHHDTLCATFSMVMFMFILSKTNFTETGLYKSLTRPPFIGFFSALIIYGTAFLIWYFAHPTKYAGNRFLFESPAFFVGYFNSFLYYCKASLPLYHFLNGYPLVKIDGESDLYAAMAIPNDLSTVFNESSPEIVFRSFFVVLTFLFSIYLFNWKVSRRFSLRLALVGTAIYLISPLLISLSALYQDYVTHGWAPLHVTFFSYYGSIILISSVLGYLLHRVGKCFPVIRWIVLLILSMSLFLGSLVTGYFNSAVSRQMHDNTQRWNAMSVFMRYLKINKVGEEDMIIVAPQLWDVNGSPGPLPKNYWDELVRGTTGMNLRFVSRLSQETIPAGKQVGFFRFERLEEGRIVVLFSISSFTWNNEASPDINAVNIISASDRPVFVFYSGENGNKRRSIRLKEIMPPKIYRGGVFAETVADDSIDFNSIRIF